MHQARELTFLLLFNKYKLNAYYVLIVGLGYNGENGLWRRHAYAKTHPVTEEDPNAYLVVRKHHKRGTAWR